MSKLTKVEIAARRKRMQEEALKSIVKSEQLNIRIDEDSMMRLYNLTAKLKKPIGTMVREWILERIALEENSKYAPLEITTTLSTLHDKIDRLETMWKAFLLQEQALNLGQTKVKNIRTKITASNYAAK